MQQHKKLWTNQEDQILFQAVKQISNDKWAEISRRYEQLYDSKYKLSSKRTGKQCRQRWYNKLDPALSKNNQQWTSEEENALLEQYQINGQKWAKIVQNLTNLGFHKRSDNNIKNHFHILVKKSINQLNSFIDIYNVKIKAKDEYRMNKKKYQYDRVYSIQKMLKKHKRITQIDIIQEKIVNQGGKIDEQKQQVYFNPTTIQQTNYEPQLSGIQMQDEQKNVLFKNVIQKNQSALKEDISLLKNIDKKLIDKLFLFCQQIFQLKQAQTLNNSIEINQTTTKIKNKFLSLNKRQDNQLLKIRNKFIQYTKNSKAITDLETKQLIEDIFKINKSFRKKIHPNLKSKDKNSNSKVRIDRKANDMFLILLKNSTQNKKSIINHKQYILSRFRCLISKILSKKQSLEQQIDKNKLLEKDQQNNIISIIGQQLGLFNECIVDFVSQFIQQMDSSSHQQKNIIRKNKVIVKNSNQKNKRSNQFIKCHEQNYDKKNLSNFLSNGSLPQSDLIQNFGSKQSFTDNKDKNHFINNMAFTPNLNFPNYEQNKQPTFNSVLSDHKKSESQMSFNFNDKSKHSSSNSLYQQDKQQLNFKYPFQMITNSFQQVSIQIPYKINQQNCLLSGFDRQIQNLMKKSGQLYKKSSNFGQISFINQQKTGFQNIKNTIFQVQNDQNVLKNSCSVKIQSQQKQMNSFSGFLSNMREVKPDTFKQHQIISFQASEQNNFPFFTTENKGFCVYNSQPYEMQIPKMLIESARNPGFPFKNYNNYDNYQHRNSLQISKLLAFDPGFGFNSARLSEIQILRQQYIEEARRSKQFQSASNMFMSQKIQSLHGSYQFLNRSKQLSNSCIYSNHSSILQIESDKMIGKEIQINANSFQQKQNGNIQPRFDFEEQFDGGNNNKPGFY